MKKKRYVNPYHRVANRFIEDHLGWIVLAIFVVVAIASYIAYSG